MQPMLKQEPRLFINHCTILCLQVIFSSSQSFLLCCGVCSPHCSTKLNLALSRTMQLLKLNFWFKKKTTTTFQAEFIHLHHFFSYFKILKLNLLEMGGRESTYPRVLRWRKSSEFPVSTAAKPAQQNSLRSLCLSIWMWFNAWHTTLISHRTLRGETTAL